MRLVSFNLNGVRSRLSAAHSIFLFMPRKKCPYPVRYRDEENVQPKRCVYKIWADGKFMIWKGLSLTQSVSQVSEQIHRSLSRPPKSGDLFEKLMRRIEDNRLLFIEVEAIQYADSALDLLKSEYNLLQESKNNPDCLNMSFEPYIPKWIPITHIEAYEEWKELLTSKN